MTAAPYDPWDHLRLTLRAWLVEEFAGYVNAEHDDAPPEFWDETAADLIDRLRIFGVTP